MNATAELPFQPQTGNAGAISGFMLAVVVHILLFAFLYFGISWVSKPPEQTSAELWPSLPPMIRSTPPPPPAPTPRAEAPPPKPDPVPEVKPELPPPDKAAIQEKFDKKLPPVKKEREIPPPKVDRDTVPKATPKPLPPLTNFQDDLKRELEKERLARQAADEERRLAQNSSKTASDQWRGQVVAKVRSYVRLPDDLQGNPECVFEVTVLPDYSVLTAKLVKKSGNPAYDEAAEKAIYAASPLPPPPPGYTPPRVFPFSFRPR